ncbi:MAG TPA: gamma-glutamyl-gamma-aminobutyrate hydrolase family protein [Candidatus Cloacimonadota bacterium]|nr:gamma-glutamyl-gamma-aminobutyrate hydrolase family protein [Candidatus Cloacimonadota bacterium]HPT71552.1 gamma-glutamyl-gamma-aminobutyrate hydrolase family protein [Candidatus Cloacimonadota bacterium]
MSRPIIGISMNYMRLGQHHQFHIRGKYIDALVANGAIPLLIPTINDPEYVEYYLQQVGAIIIIGGLDYPPSLYGQEPHPMLDPCHSRRTEADFLLVKKALEMKKPLIGFCAGMQLLNIYFGGKLIQHIDNLDDHFGEKYHKINILGGRWLPQIFAKNEIIVNSNHHQAVDPAHIGKGLSIVAKADDGMIEALEYESEQMVLGIQWHPERIIDPEVSRPIFQFLNKLAGRNATF